MSGLRLSALLAVAALWPLAGCEPTGPGDLNGDGAVDALDLAIVMGCQGAAASGSCAAADADGDGDVDTADRNRVVAHLDDLSCNGAAALCDRRYDEIASVTTHNAFSALDAGFNFVLANQQFGLTRQLQDGVRGFMLDTYLFDPATGMTGVGEVTFCHSFCRVGPLPSSQPASEGFAEFVDYLDVHLAEVVTFIFEAYVSEADVAAALADSGLLEYAHVQVPGAPWPTLREMIASGKRLVVFTDDAGASLPWHHYVWSYAFETHFDNAQDPLPSGLLRCYDLRGTPPADLFILNHFISGATIDGVPCFAGCAELGALVNPFAFLLGRALDCWSCQGRIPNFVTVDFYDEGDVFEVVDALNGLIEFDAGTSVGAVCDHS